MSQEGPQHQGSPARLNRPLVAGGAIVLGLLLVAVFGPMLAPKDPLARTLVAEIGGRRLGVPFPPFQSWEFPLGSDRLGRDLWSRLLWAVRPTLILVTLVAAIRLVVGVFVGAVAGWSRGFAGRACNTLTDAALAVPVLLVALAAITAVGIEVGLPAFIVGMTLTGWAETAQAVRAQTRLVAARPYVQAARALGANGPQILIRHIWRHLAPLLAMLMAFEISAALMLAGALGFLGYFIGGGVWVILDGNYIPVAERVAGLPELGQLVGAAELRVSSRPPWEMIFPGLVIVVAILGFTLLGEGLRRRQTRETAPGPSWLGRLLGGAGTRLEEAAVARAGQLDGRFGRVAGAAVAIGALVLVAALWRPGGAAPTATAPAAGGPALAAQNGWVAERGNAYGTLRASATPTSPVVAWEFADDAGIAGGPAVAPDGAVYVTNTAGVLHALGPDGQQRWSAAVEGDPVGSPAVAPDGTVYVADRGGGLSAFSTGGELRWRFQSTYRPEATSGPVVGPDGTIFYTLVDGVQAVSPAGTGLWVGSNRDLPYEEMLPRLSPDAALVFLKDSAFSTVDGSRQDLTIVPEQPRFADAEFVVGADGGTYYLTEHRIVPWRRVEAGVAVQPALGWSAANVLFLPADAGVTAEGTAWMLYSVEYSDTRLVWIDGEGRQIGEVAAPLRASRAIAVADDGTVQLCGSGRNARLRCAAFSPAAGDEPLWELELGERGAAASGGAVVGERVYIATDDGHLYALE